MKLVRDYEMGKPLLVDEIPKDYQYQPIACSGSLVFYSDTQDIGEELLIRLILRVDPPSEPEWAAEIEVGTMWIDRSAYRNCDVLPKAGAEIFIGNEALRKASEDQK